MRVGSLFSGIGGIDLGLQRAGMEIVWQVENDEWCRRVLARHFPNAVRYGDVRDCHGEAVADCDNAGLEGRNSEVVRERTRQQPTGPGRTLPPVDLICGGFPCQPVSHAGRRLGAEDSRWLWPEFMRIIREVRPEWVLVENVPGLLSIEDGRLFGGVLRDLAEGGYDAEWDCIPAAALGAPHIRDRVFIVAHATSSRHGTGQPSEGRALRDEARGSQPERRGGIPNTASQGWGREGAVFARAAEGTGALSLAARSGWWSAQCRLGEPSHGLPEGLVCGGWECGVPRTVKGQKDRVDRLRGLGNAVVPQVAEYIGRMIIEVWVL